MKNYRSVGQRCAVDLDYLAGSRKKELVIDRLEQLGFEILRLDVAEVAARLVGKAYYAVGSELRNAPNAFDCSSFVKWCFGQVGIWLPRRAVQQKAFAEDVSGAQAIPGDLIFTSGNGNYYNQDPASKVGHVGLFTKRLTVIHASQKHQGIVESSLPEFLLSGEPRGLGRIVPAGSDIVTLIVPNRHEIESDDDIKWLLKTGPL